MSQRPKRQQQPFKFWFPYWANPTPTPPRPPAPTPQRTPSGVPSQSKELPQSSSPPQPTAAARRSQPSPSPSSSESSSPSPSRKSSSRLKPAEQRGKQQPSPSRPAIKPSSPSRAVPAQPSPQGSVAQHATPSTPQGAPDLQPPTAVSSSSLPEPTTKPPPSESQTQRKKIPELIPTKPVSEPAEFETQPKHRFETALTSADSLQRDNPAESELEKAKTQFQPPIAESQPEEITNKKSEPKLETSTHQKLNERPKDIPKEETTQPDLKPKKDAGTSKQQKLNENPKGIPEDKTKPDFEPKQNILTSQVSKLNENFEGTRREKTARPSSASKQDIGTSIQQILDENPKSTQQDKTKADLEPTQNIQTFQVPKVSEKPEEITEENNKDKSENMRPPEILKSDRMHEEFNNNEPQKNQQLHKKPHPSASETLNKKLERDLTIMGFDAEPPKPHPNTGDLISDTRVSEQEKLTKQQKLDGKETNKHESIGNVSKVSISAGPWTSSCGGERANFQKEIGEGLSKLVQKLGIGYSGHAGSDQGVSIITLAGKNKGAAMFIGNEGITKQGPKGKEKGKIEAKSDEKGYNDTVNGDSPLAASVNSNVQSINNSILNESKCKEENPGVHLVFSTKPTETMSLKGKMETLRTQKAASSITTPHKITYEPNIRRRCFRGLLMEPSEDDQEDPQKNRRHGCRFSCDEKKKGKENNDEGTSMPNRNG